MSKQHCRSNRQLCCLLLRQCCRFWQQCRSNVRLCRKDEISTQNLFDIVAVFVNKVERCFDIVVGVDRALKRLNLELTTPSDIQACRTLYQHSPTSQNLHCQTILTWGPQRLYILGLLVISSSSSSSSSFMFYYAVMAGVVGRRCREWVKNHE